MAGEPGVLHTGAAKQRRLWNASFSRGHRSRPGSACTRPYRPPRHAGLDTADHRAGRTAADDDTNGTLECLVALENVWEARTTGKLAADSGEAQDRSGLCLACPGTNAHGGFSRFMEAYAAAPQFTSVAGGKLSGAPVGVSSWTVVQAANAGLPERRAEIIAEGMAGLEHTNAMYRMLALEAARVFPEELLKRKDLLLRLTLDEGEYVKAAALGNLVTIVQSPALRDLMSSAEIRKAAEAVLDAPDTSERNRGTARTVIRLADAQVGREANR
jgi:hypothetical protein